MKLTLWEVDMVGVDCMLILWEDTGFSNHSYQCTAHTTSVPSKKLSLARLQ